MAWDGSGHVAPIRLSSLRYGYFDPLAGNSYSTPYTSVADLMHESASISLVNSTYNGTHRTMQNKHWMLTQSQSYNGSGSEPGIMASVEIDRRTHRLTKPYQWASRSASPMWFNCRHDILAESLQHAGFSYTPFSSGNTGARRTAIATLGFEVNQPYHLWEPYFWMYSVWHPTQYSIWTERGGFKFSNVIGHPHQALNSLYPNINAYGNSETTPYWEWLKGFGPYTAIADKDPLRTCYFRPCVQNQYCFGASDSHPSSGSNNGMSSRLGIGALSASPTFRAVDDQGTIRITKNAMARFKIETSDWEAIKRKTGFEGVKIFAVFCPGVPWFLESFDSYPYVPEGDYDLTGTYPHIGEETYYTSFIPYEIGPVYEYQDGVYTYFEADLFHDPSWHTERDVIDTGSTLSEARFRNFYASGKVVQVSSSMIWSDTSGWYSQFPSNAATYITFVGFGIGLTRYSTKITNANHSWHGSTNTSTGYTNIASIAYPFPGVWFFHPTYKFGPWASSGTSTTVPSTSLNNFIVIQTRTAMTPNQTPISA